MPSYDAFLSHNSLDKENVRKIAEALTAKGLSVWFDEWELRPGLPWQAEIESAFDDCRATVVFIGPHGLGKWEIPELRLALDRQVHDEHRVIPVLLPGVEQESINKIPSFLRQHNWIDFRRSISDEAALKRLIWGITGIRPESSTPTPTEPPPAPPDPTTEALGVLSQHFRKGNATFFLGWDADAVNGAAPTLTSEIARALLLDLEVIQPTYDQLLPPFDLAGLYYAIGKSGESSLEDKVVELLTTRQSPLTETHAKLAVLLRRLSKRQARRLRRHVPQLLVTTTPDLLLEQTLLRAGQPFTRVVQHRSAQKLTINEYHTIKIDSDEITVTFDKPDPPLQDPLKGRLVKGRLDNVEDLDNIIAKAGKREITNRSPGGGENQLSGFALESLTEPILYKPLGSQDVLDSCVISVSQFFEFAQRASQRSCIPEEIIAIIATTPAVFIGCGYLDPDFRLLCHLLLRKQVEVETNNSFRYSLQLLPQVTAQAQTAGANEPCHSRLIEVGSSRVDLQACKLEYSIVSPK